MNAIETLKKYQDESHKPRLNISEINNVASDDPDTHCFELSIYSEYSECRWQTYTGYGSYEEHPDFGALYDLNHAQDQKSFDLIAAALNNEDLIRTEIEIDESKIDYGQWQDD